MCLGGIWYAVYMYFLARHRAGLISGFLFGTIGIFLLALLSLMFPLMEMLTAPLLLPGKFFASMLAGSSATTPMVLFLYLLTGVFYAVIGLIVDLVCTKLFIKNPD